MSERRNNFWSRTPVKLLWINFALFILSLAADAFKAQIPWLATLGITSTYVLQGGLLAVSLLATILLSEIERVREEIGSAERSLLKEITATDERTTKFRDELAKGIVEYQGHSYRSLRYDPAHGAIYYGEVSHSNRNILFNNETFKRILQVASQEHSRLKKPKDERGSLLYMVGYAASSRFAKHFQDHVESKNIAFDLTSWLKEWTAYDSDAGFGHMEVRELKAHGDTAQVVIWNSFLTHGENFGGDEPLCGFMVGYIEGLLKNFATALYNDYGVVRDAIQVHHDLKLDCYHGHQNPRKGCVFRVVVPKASNPAEATSV